MSYFINLSILRKNREFRLLYFGQFISFAGTMITNVALPYQIYQLTHSTLMVGLLSLAQLLPLLVTALVGGVFADRYHRRLMLLLSETFLALGCLLLMFNASLATPQIALLFIVAPLMSAITGFHRPALDSLNQEIVAKRDFTQVSALLNFKFSFCMIAGPALAGLIIARFGTVAVYAIDAGTFFLSLLAIYLIQEKQRPKAEATLGTWAALKEGFRYALSRQELLGTYIVDFMAMIFGMPMALFPAIAQVNGGAQTLGLLYSAPAVGALLISLLSGWTEKIKRHGLAISWAAMGWGFAIILFGLVPNLYGSLFFLALAGAFDAISGVFRQTMWNETIPNKFRGRLSGIEIISYLSGPKLGDTEAGLVAAAFGVTASIVSGGVLCILSVGLCSYYLPKFRRYRSA